MAEQDPIERFFPESYMQRLDEAHDVQARLSFTESLLRDFGRAREWLRDEKHDENEAYATLKSLRAELLARTMRVDAEREERAKTAGKPFSLGARVARRPLTAVTAATSVGIRFPPLCAPSEGAVPVPVFLEGTSVTPGGGSGAITTHPTTDSWEAPEPHYQGVLHASNFPFFSLSYWLHNWRYVIPFPCVPCDGRLTYRVYFETGGLFRASALGASLMNWINVREIADVSTGIDFSSAPDYEVWPIDRHWPFFASFMFEEIWSGVTLQGSFAVKRGKAPVLAVIVGVIVGVGNGQFTIFNAGFHPWEMQLFPPGGFPQPPDLQFHAKVHYRYEPDGGVFQP